MASVFKRGGKKAKGYWYASWNNHKGKRQTECTRTTDKATAERIARKYEADAALRRDGVIDPTLDATSKESGRLIDSHLTDYESKMRAANSTDDHGHLRAFIPRSRVRRGWSTATHVFPRRTRSPAGDRNGRRDG